MSSYTQVLVEKGLVTMEDIDTAERTRDDQGLRLDQALIQNGALSERAFLKVMGERLAVELTRRSDGATSSGSWRRVFHPGRCTTAGLMNTHTNRHLLYCRFLCMCCLLHTPTRCLPYISAGMSPVLSGIGYLCFAPEA